MHTLAPLPRSSALRFDVRAHLDYGYRNDDSGDDDGSDGVEAHSSRESRFVGDVARERIRVALRTVRARGLKGWPFVAAVSELSRVDFETVQYVLGPVSDLRDSVTTCEWKRSIAA